MKELKNTVNALHRDFGWVKTDVSATISIKHGHIVVEVKAIEMHTKDNQKIIVSLEDLSSPSEIINDLKAIFEISKESLS